MIDNGMEDAALGRVAMERALQDQERAARLWQDILHDKRTNGPFKAMIDTFRSRATEALRDLTICDPHDAAMVRQCQDHIQRYLEAMLLVKEFEEGAKAYDANADVPSDEDDEPTINLEP